MPNSIWQKLSSVWKRLKSTQDKTPKNLEECFHALDELLVEEDKLFIMTHEEYDMIELHSSLGRYIRNEWGLWGPRTSGTTDIYLFFTALGVYHADDMSGIILDSYWRHLHGKPIDLEGQVKHYQEYWSNITTD